MGKGSVMVYIALTGLILFLISQNSTTTKPSHHRHRRLKLRSNFTFPASKINNNINNNNNNGTNKRHEAIPFDPLVADIERKREDKQWEREYFRHAHKEVDDVAAQVAEGQPEWEDFTNAEDYLNDEEKFNVTNRLVLLFPKVDVDPVDGYATEHELTEWILKNSEREVMHRTEREMEVHDKNHDGLVSFHEYEPPAWARNSDNDSFGYEMGWWKGEHFNASDANGDGFLNLTEYNDFMHPADSKNPKLLQWLCQEEIRERDSDKDGKVNFKEFFHGLFDTLRNYEEDSHDSSHDSEESSEAPAKKLFSELDKDGDRYLSAAELLPVIDKFHPSERYYAKQQADYMISQADSDKDGRLTLAEMIDHPYVFYSAIFNEDEEDEYDLHDEFR